MIYCKRLVKGQDLKLEIEKLTKENNIKAGVVLSSVGCLTELTYRTSDGVTVVNKSGHFEILSLNGTLSPDGSHLHISVSGKEEGSDEEKCFGGHLKEGCIVNTTCELVIKEIKNYKFKREIDETTGYKELEITNE